MDEVNRELFGTICIRIMAGESVHAACVAEGAPNHRTFYGWLHKYPELRPQFVDACAIRAIHYIDLINDEIQALRTAATDRATTQEQVDVISAKIEAYKELIEHLQHEAEFTTPKPLTPEQYFATLHEHLQNAALP